MKKNISYSQVNLFLEKIGGKEVWDDVLSGRKMIHIKEPEASLFDNFGRRIPENLSASVSDVEKEFFFDVIKLKNNDYEERLKNFYRYSETDIRVEEFRSKIKNLVNLISENPWISNILKGPWLPIIIPKINNYHNHFGRLICHDLGFIGESYQKLLKGSFLISNNILEEKDKISNNELSRNSDLIDKASRRPIIGIHFPSALQGFSVLASREQMKFLPERFYLSGIDAIWAMIMYPDVLAKNFNVPGIYLSGIDWSINKTLYFRIYDHELSVVKMPSLGTFSDGGTSSGLFFF